MTLDADFLRLKTPMGPLDILCKAIGIDWPPPEDLSFGGRRYKLLRRSQLDDDVADHPNLARGAEYELEK